MSGATIRAQYNPRETPEGRLIWDVRRLVRLSNALPVTEVALADIAEMDEDWWGPLTPREVADHWRLARSVDLSCPILLCAEGRLMDGMHRILRATMEGRTALPARRFPVTPPPDHRDVPLDDLPYD